MLEHIYYNERLSAGLKALPNKISSFASTQAAWRFYGNETVSLPVLQEPLTVAAHEGIASHCSQYVLCVHDRSHLKYKHFNKADTYAITNEMDVGCDLQISLILRANAGNDYLHKVSTKVFDNQAMLFVEDLKIKTMNKSAKGMLDKPGPARKWIESLD